jgi:CRP/FNR family cyclic AMP-dependent transcriptional regulator
MDDPLRYLRISTIRSFERGQIIYSEGDPATNIYIVISGMVKVARARDDGRELVMSVYRSDDIFGESALIECYRSCSAVALEDTKVMSWTAVQIEASGSENPKLLYALLQIMTQRLAQCERRIKSMIVEDARHRLAHLLLEFSKAMPGDSGGGPSRMEPLTHELLSSYVGTSREVVTHFMNQFRRLGCISYSRKGILVFRDRLQMVISAKPEQTAADPVPRSISPRSAGENVRAGENVIEVPRELSTTAASR